MNNADSRRRRWLRWGLGFGFWTLLGLFAATQATLVVRSASKVESSHNGTPLQVSWPEALAIGLAEAYVWGLMALIIFALGRRFPLDRQHWRRSLLVHLGAAAGVALVAAVLSVLANELRRRDLPKPMASAEMLELFLVAKFHPGYLYYWMILGAAQGMAFYRRYRERELRASQLEAELARAQLLVLKMQMHPHFLFNTLNAISALMHQDVELADRMIARLGDLLRATLDNSGTQEVSLRQELEFIRPYLEIEQARLGPRLRLETDIDPAALDARVPNLILQPLVENAIRHGIAPRAEPGRLEIRARRLPEAVQIQVGDDGPGLKDNGPTREGVGLANTRARLQHLYGADHHLELSNGPGRGLLVTLTLPCRDASEAPIAHAHADRG